MRRGGEAEETVLETPRLRLVPLTLRFADVYNERECRTAEDHWTQHGFGHWALLAAQSGEFIGAAEVHFAYPGVAGIPAAETEVGIEILRHHQRHGYATEAMTAVVSDAWQRTSADVLVAYTRPDHIVSIKLMTRLGFEYRSDGTGRDGNPISVYALARPT